MEQTAVEWIVQQLNPSIALQQKYIDELKEQAKEMEKQQIIDAFESGVYDGGENVSQYNMNSEQYYKETFK